jgi:hypothetical protein
MRTPIVPDARTDPGLSKEKKQLLILGALSLVLVGVMASSFGDDGTEAVVESESGEPVAAASTAPADATPVAIPAAPASSNAVLSEMAGSGVNDGVFESFWSVAAPMEARVEELPPPPITLNATIVGDTGRMAVIDGSLRQNGDIIGGWSIEGIRMREVTLRSPGDRLVTVAMPLLQPPTLAMPSPGPHQTDESPESDPEAGDA